MKRKITVLIGAVVLLAVLIGVYYMVKGHSAKEEESKETIIDLTADRIQAISWTPKGGKALSFRRVDGQWSYDGDPAFKVDQTAMNTVCSGVTGVAVNQVMEDVSDLGQYGLEEPEYKLEVTDTEGNKDVLYLGDDNEAVNSLYVMKEGDDKTVYSVMASLKSAVAKQLSELKASEDSSVGEPVS